MKEEPAESVTTIKRARPCADCGYNLYGLPRQGTCPECGQAYKSRKQDATAKNPRRQLAQYRRILKRNESELRWVPAWWIVAGSALAACYFLKAGCNGWGIAIFVTIVAALRHLTRVFNHKDTKEKIEAIDAMAARE